MAYDEKLADRLRLALADVPRVQEKIMFRGVSFLVNGKMGISVSADELMCRVGPEAAPAALKKKGSRQVIMRGKPMTGWIKVNEEGFKNKKDFEYWIGLSLAFNSEAKASKKRSMKKK